MNGSERRDTKWIYMNISTTLHRLHLIDEALEGKIDDVAMDTYWIDD